jgi:hypothetical protein
MNTIIGLPRWQAPDAYYSQTNNVVEAILAKTGANRKLESCGPTSAVMLVDALGALHPTMTPGGWQPQPEDLLAAWMNDPRNYGAMRHIRSDIDPANIMGNEVPQWYEVAVPAVFGVKARFYWGSGTAEICRAMTNGRGVMVALKKPGHFIAIVAVDMDIGEAIYHDPWPDNAWPIYNQGKPGAGRRVKFADLADNLQGYRVEIGT